MKRLLGLESKPRRLVLTTEIETIGPKPPKPPQPPRPPAQPRTEPPRPVAAAFPPPEGEYRFLALDVETARPDMWSICQLGIAAVGLDGEIRTYSTLINPNCEFARSHVAIHGINDRSVRGAPNIFAAFEPLLPLLGRHALIQHSTFDQRAIEAAYLDARKPVPRLAWRDSVQIARAAWPEFRGAGGHGLRHLKQALRLEFQHHDAGEDARAAAQVVLLAEQRLGRPFDQIANAKAPSAAGTREASTPKIALDGAADGPLAGQIAVFTGELSMPRGEAAARAAAIGLSVRTTVSRQTNFVIVGGPGPSCDSPTGKHRCAMEFVAAGAPIRIIGEAEFAVLLAEAGGVPPVVRAVPQPTSPPVSPRAAGEVVVIAGEIALDRLEASARAEAAGLTVMTNVTKRTTLVVVRDADLAPEAERTTRHRSAEAALAKGQVLRIIGEAEFMTLIGAE